MSSQSTWKRTPIFTKEDVKRISAKATPWQRLRLLFRPSRYALDGQTMLRFKVLDGKTFVKDIEVEDD